MANLIPFLRTERQRENAMITRGKMTPRVKSRYSKAWRRVKHSKSRRAALKENKYNMKSQFGMEGHSSWWD